MSSEGSERRQAKSTSFESDATTLEMEDEDMHHGNNNNNNNNFAYQVPSIRFNLEPQPEVTITVPTSEKQILDASELKHKLFSISNDHERDPASIECYDDFSQAPLVIYIKDLTFSYSSREKLIEGLNVNIAKGQIYGLLGPSGCGKSTVLKLILGLVRPKKGKVCVYGQSPLTPGCPVPGPGVGYMPQDLTLMANMTVADVFMYYGRLNHMRATEVGKRSAELIDLLQIPSASRPIERLSGGQQRRASLAVALLHSPPLLILDEPTVGIDPVLRNKIWCYLQELALKEKKTVITSSIFYYQQQCFRRSQI